MRRSLLGTSFAVTLFALAAFACGGSDEKGTGGAGTGGAGTGGAGTGGAGTGGAAQGGEKQPCYPNGTCNAGLTCLSDLCVQAGDAAPSDAAPDAPTPTCTGTPTPCSPAAGDAGSDAAAPDAGVGACNSVQGCSLGAAACSGTAQFCGNFDNQTCGKAGEPYCVWSGVTACQETCPGMTTAAGCTATQGCAWSGSACAVDYALACTQATSEAICLERAGTCKWGSQCGGTPTPCASMSTQDACVKQGCTWQ